MYPPSFISFLFYLFLMGKKWFFFICVLKISMMIVCFFFSTIIYRLYKYTIYDCSIINDAVNVYIIHITLSVVFFFFCKKWDHRETWFLFPFFFAFMPFFLLSLSLYLSSLCLRACWVIEYNIFFLSFNFQLLHLTWSFFF